MTLEEYVNANLMNAIVRGYTKYGEVLVRIKELAGKNIKVSFTSFTGVPEILRIDIPVEGFVLTIVGKMTGSEEGVYVYTALDKVGVLQRRTKPRYASFEACSIYGFNTLIIDVSENGCQVISEFKPKVKESIELTFAKKGNEVIEGVTMWAVEEEECYRYGIYIPNATAFWNKLVESYKKIGEVL